AEVTQPGQFGQGKRGEGAVDERRERERCVEQHAAVALGEVEELRVLRHAQVRDQQAETGGAGEKPGDRPRPRVPAGPRARAAVRHDRGARVREQAPRLVEQRVVRVEVADLKVALEDTGAPLKRAAYI